MPYHSGAARPDPPDPGPASGPAWPPLAEPLLNSTTLRGRTYYLVRWQGRPSAAASWEPLFAYARKHARASAHTHTHAHPHGLPVDHLALFPEPGSPGSRSARLAAARRPNAVGARRRAGAPSPSGAPPGPRLAPSHASSGPIPCRLGGGAGGHAAAGFPHPLPVAGRLGGLVARTLSEVQHVPRGRLPARRRGLRGRGRLAPGGGLARLSLGLARADRRLLRPRYGATVRVY